MYIGAESQHTALGSKIVGRCFHIAVVGVSPALAELGEKSPTIVVAVGVLLQEQNGESFFHALVDDGDEEGNANWTLS